MGGEVQRVFLICLWFYWCYVEELGFDLGRLVIYNCYFVLFFRKYVDRYIILRFGLSYYVMEFYNDFVIGRGLGYFMKDMVFILIRYNQFLRLKSRD